MKQILLGSPGTLSLSHCLTLFVTLSAQAGKGGGCLGKISQVHQHKAFVWQQRQEGSSNLVCNLKNEVTPQWFTSASIAGIDELVESR